MCNFDCHFFCSSRTSNYKCTNLKKYLHSLLSENGHCSPRKKLGHSMNETFFVLNKYGNNLTALMQNARNPLFSWPTHLCPLWVSKNNEGSTILLNWFMPFFIKKNCKTARWLTYNSHFRINNSYLLPFLLSSWKVLLKKG